MTHLEYNGFEYHIIERHPPMGLNFWWRDLSVIEPTQALEEYGLRFDGDVYERMAEHE